MHEQRQCLYYYLFPMFEGILLPDELENLMLLLYAMLLLGGFKKSPVPLHNINLAETVLKRYSIELKASNIPCRFVSHQIIHMPDDVKKFQTGIENLSAFPYENFQSFFRHAALRSGNLPVEQIRNRLIERSKYMLPTSSDGLIIADKFDLEREVRLKHAKEQNSPVKFFEKGEKWPQKLYFAEFIISNKFPNNICLMKDGSVIVCSQIILNSNFSNAPDYTLIGRKFSKMENAFVAPFISSEFNIFKASDLNESSVSFNVRELKCKMCPFPLEPTGPPNILDPSIKWYLVPLHHSVCE